MKTTILCIGIYLLGFQTYAQQSMSNLNKYPKSVLIKVYEVSQKVTLSTEKQQALAETYLKGENELAQAILSKASRKDINAIKAKYESAIRKGLTVEELKLLDKREYVNDGSLHVKTSKFYAAYNYAAELKLTKPQIDSVLVNGIRFERASANFVGQSVGDRFDAQGYENRVLPQILNEEQFSFLFTVKLKEIARSQALVDWNEAKKRGLTLGVDSVAAIDKMTKYTMERGGIGERFKSDPAKRNTLYASLDESIPELLKKLKFARQYGNPLDDKGNVSKSSY